MIDFISSFFLVVGAVVIIATYMKSRVLEPNVGYHPNALAVFSFALAFTMLATAGALMF